MTKQQIRNEYRKKRLSITPRELTKLDDLMLIQFQSIEIPFLYSLLSYWPIEENNEPNTHPLTEYLKFRNPELKIAYPVSDFSTLRMSAIVTEIDTPFRKTNLNIYEPQEGEELPPEQLDIIFVPLLAFDRKGYRVGYGKGFYDQYLPLCRKDCIKVGFSFFDALEVDIDKEQFDVPLNLCVTPQTVYVF
jgi:5-formyltetrahydrofolate cyclo-ligase